MNFYQTFSSRLKEARKKSGLSQKELADKVQVSQGTISAYEKGTGDKGSGPTIEKVARIAAALDVSLDWLCGADEQKPASAEIDPAAWLSYLFRLLDNPRATIYYYETGHPFTEDYEVKSSFKRSMVLSVPDVEESDMELGKEVAEILFYGKEMQKFFQTYQLVSALREKGADKSICDGLINALAKDNSNLFAPDESLPF